MDNNKEIFEAILDDSDNEYEFYTMSKDRVYLLIRKVSFNDSDFLFYGIKSDDTHMLKLDDITEEEAVRIVLNYTKTMIGVINWEVNTMRR